MEKDTKKIIVGVGVLSMTALLAYLLLKKAPADGEVCIDDSDCPEWFRCIDGACVPY